MAKKVSIKKRTNGGELINLYGEMCCDGEMVSVYTKDANYGLYNIERFYGGVLTTTSFRAFFCEDK